MGTPSIPGSFHLLESFDSLAFILNGELISFLLENGALNSLALRNEA